MSEDNTSMEEGNSQEPVPQENLENINPDVSQPQKMEELNLPSAEEIKGQEFDDSSYQDQEQEILEQASADEQVPVEQPTVTPEGDQAPEPEEPEFDPLLLNAAGISEEQARSQFGTPEALESAVNLLDSRYVEEGRRQLEARSQQYQQPQETVQPAPQTRQEPQVDVQPDQAPEFKLPDPVDGEEDWDPNTKNLIDSLNKHYQQQWSQLRQHVDQQQDAILAMAQERQRESQQQYVHEFDSFVNDLGDEWTPVLGKGSGFDLSRESLAFQNRAHLDSVAAQLAAGRNAQGQPELGRKETLSRALRIAFPNEQDKSVRNEAKEEIQGQVRQRQNMMTARPTQRRSSPVTGEEKAMETVENFFKSRGISIQEDDFDYSAI